MPGPVTLAMASQELARRVIQSMNLATASKLSLRRAVAEQPLFLQNRVFKEISPTISMQLVTNMFYSINLIIQE
jgi:hypothetical protein